MKRSGDAWIPDFEGWLKYLSRGFCPFSHFRWCLTCMRCEFWFECFANLLSSYTCACYGHFGGYLTDFLLLSSAFLFVILPERDELRRYLASSSSVDRALERVYELLSFQLWDPLHIGDRWISRRLRSLTPQFGFTREQVLRVANVAWLLNSFVVRSTDKYLVSLLQSVGVDAKFGFPRFKGRVLPVCVPRSYASFVRLLDRASRHPVIAPFSIHFLRSHESILALQTRLLPLAFAAEDASYECQVLARVVR